MKVFLDELTWPEVAQRINSGRTTALVLLGSTENHGPHAPLGTDTIIAAAVGRETARLLDATATPVLPFGYCPQHRGFAGSISLSNRTIATILTEIAGNLARSGFTDIVFLSGHGGNATAIDLAISETKEAQPSLNCVHARMLPVQTSDWFRDAVSQHLGTPLSEIWGAHGGEQETSAVLHARPDLVKLELAPPEPDMSAYLHKTRDSVATASDFDLAAHTAHGSWGDASRATAEQGEAFVRLVAQTLAERIRPLLSAATVSGETQT